MTKQTRKCAQREMLIVLNVDTNLKFRCEICNFNGQHDFGQPVRKQVSLSAKLDSLLKPSQSTIVEGTVQREPSVGSQKGITLLSATKVAIVCRLHVQNIRLIRDYWYLQTQSFYVTSYL